MTPPRPSATWVPDRGEVIWIDHNPQAGREMKDHHPFLVLSTAPFHTSVGLVVGFAMPSAAYNRGSSLAVDLGPIPEGQMPTALCSATNSNPSIGRLGVPGPIPWAHSTTTDWTRCWRSWGRSWGLWCSAPGARHGFQS